MVWESDFPLLFVTLFQKPELTFQLKYWNFTYKKIRNGTVFKSIKTGSLFEHVIIETFLNKNLIFKVDDFFLNKWCL